MFRFAILSAVSSKQQAAKDKTSLDDQINICRRMTEQGWRETAGPYIVRGQNRTQYLNLRDAEIEIPAIGEMLEAAKRGEYDVLIVYNHDRLRDLLTLVYAALTDYRVQLFSISAQNYPVPPDKYDQYDNDINDLLIGISAIRSKSEITNMRRKYRVGNRNRITVHGLPIQIPFAYRKPLDESYNRKAIPEPIPELARALIEIKDLLLDGKSVSQLIQHLNEKNIPPPRAAKWYPQTIRGILRNPFYAGYVMFEKKRVVKDRRNNRSVRIINPTPLKAKGKHAPLWDDVTHEAIIAEFKARGINYTRRQNNQFTGILHCGECGASMWLYYSGPRESRQIWRCSKAKSLHPSVTHSEAIRQTGIFLRENLSASLDQREIKLRAKSAPIAPAIILKDLNTQRERIVDGYQRGLIPLRSFETRAMEIDEKIRSIAEQAASEEQRKREAQTQINAIQNTLGAKAEIIPLWIEKDDPLKVNHILKLLFSEVIINKGEIIYNWN